MVSDFNLALFLRVKVVENKDAYAADQYLDSYA